MEANMCDANQLDVDILLPPRKRHLVGFIKETSDSSGQTSDSNRPDSQRNPPIIPYFSPSTSEIVTHTKGLASSLIRNSNLSPEELVEVTKSEARAARAAAEQKAAIAAKAVAKAKSALELVARFNQERALKKNKLKNHVPVRLLYKKHQHVENCRSDEELAHRLHRAMNNTPRISKTLTSQSRSPKTKKYKGSTYSDRIAVPKGVLIVRGSAASYEKTRHAAL